MQELILKSDLSPSKLEALINFLKKWGIDVELKGAKERKKKDKFDFSLSVGLWQDNKIDADTLRKQVWTRDL
jgi:hypothetical protein